MNVEEKFLYHRLESLAIEMAEVALLLDALGYGKKYDEMTGASKIYLEWAKSIKEGDEE